MGIVDINYPSGGIRHTIQPSGAGGWLIGDRDRDRPDQSRYRLGGTS